MHGATIIRSHMNMHEQWRRRSFFKRKYDAAQNMLNWDAAFFTRETLRTSCHVMFVKIKTCNCADSTVLYLHAHIM